MGLFSNLFGKGGKGAKHYRDGLAKAEKGDWSGAIQAYDLALRVDASEEVRASALFNRGLAHAKLGHFDEAQKDYKMIIEGQSVPSRIKSEAKDNLNRLKKRRERESQ